MKESGAFIMIIGLAVCLVLMLIAIAVLTGDPGATTVPIPPVPTLGGL